LNKVYEVYVDAENREEAERKGIEMLENGEGDLVDDYYADETKVEEIVSYKAEQRLIITLRHYADAANVDEAYEYAKRQFADDLSSMRHTVAGDDIVYVEAGEIVVDKAQTNNK
jgi:hypothetical protein